MFRITTLTGAGIAVALAIVHGLVPDDLVVDSTTVALLLIASSFVAVSFVPNFSDHLTKMNLLGRGLKFREQVEKAAMEVDFSLVVHGAGEGRRGEAPGPSVSPVPIDEPLYRLINEDPNLAVAGLSIEIEKAVREVAAASGLADQTANLPLPQTLRLLREQGRLGARQADLLQRIADLRNLALHGGRITKTDAYAFFRIVERLNEPLSQDRRELTPPHTAEA